MVKLTISLIILLTFTASPVAAAAEPANPDVVIDIISPAQDANLKLTVPVMLHYQISLAGAAFEYRRHVYVYMNDKKISRLRQLSGRYLLPKPSLNTRKICIGVETEDDNLIPQRCVSVKVYSPQGAKDCSEKKCGDDTEDENDPLYLSPFYVPPQYTPPSFTTPH